MLNNLVYQAEAIFIVSDNISSQPHSSIRFPQRVRELLSQGSLCSKYLLPVKYIANRDSPTKYRLLVHHLNHKCTLNNLTQPSAYWFKQEKNKGKEKQEKQGSGL